MSYHNSKSKCKSKHNILFINMMLRSRPQNEKDQNNELGYNQQHYFNI